MNKITTPAALEDLRELLCHERSVQEKVVAVCGGTGCRAYDWDALIDALRTELKNSGLEDKVAVRITGCHGLCEKGPLVVIHPEKIFYQQVKPGDIPELVARTLKKGEVVERLLYVDPATEQRAYTEDDVGFYTKQMRLVLGNNGRIDPADISDYIAIGGYASLVKAR